MNNKVELNHKLHLTLKEASEYTGIGINRLREISNEYQYLVLFVGTKRLLKRKELETFLENLNSI